MTDGAESISGSRMWTTQQQSAFFVIAITSPVELPG
jgi:hypothetical protein